MKGSSQTHVVKYKKENYFDDFWRWVISKKTKKWIYILLLGLSGYIAIESINYFNFSKYAAILGYGMIGGFIGMALSEVFSLTSAYRTIKNRESKFKTSDGLMILKSSSIELTIGNTREVIFLSQIKKLKKIKNTIYFEFERDNNFPFRINLFELSKNAKQDLEIFIKKNNFKIE